MLALYRADRQADALQAYQEARRTARRGARHRAGRAAPRAGGGCTRRRTPSLALPMRRAASRTPRAGRRGPSRSRRRRSPARRRALPRGVVTFLLTDIEALVALWEADPDAMAAALELHDELDRAHRRAPRRTAPEDEGRGRLDAHRVPARLRRGRVRGESCASRWPTAAWPGGLDLRVRIALHTGEAHERDGDYFGPALNRAARLRALAGGGVTLLSQATTEIVHDRLPAGTELVDLGTPRAARLSRPERVFELREAGRGRRDRPAGPRRGDPQDGDGAVRLHQSTPAPRAEELDAEARRRVSSHCARRHARTVLERHGASGPGLSGRRAHGGVRRPAAARGRRASRRARRGSSCAQALPALAGELAPPSSVELAARAWASPPARSSPTEPAPGCPPAGRDRERREAPRGAGGPRRDRRWTGHTEARARIGHDRPRAARGAATSRRPSSSLGSGPPERAPTASTRRSWDAAGSSDALSGAFEAAASTAQLPPRDRARRGGRGEVAPRGRVHARPRRRGDRALAGAASPTARASPTGRSPSWSATWPGGAAATPRRRCGARSRPSWPTIRKAEPDRRGWPRRDRTRRNRAEHGTREDLLGGAQALRGARAAAAARRRARRPPVGGGDLPRPRGARGGPGARRADRAALRGAARAARGPPGLGRRKAERRLDPAGAAGARGEHASSSTTWSRPCPRTPPSASPRPARATRCSPRSCSRC